MGTAAGAAPPEAAAPSAEVGVCERCSHAGHVVPVGVPTAAVVYYHGGGWVVAREWLCGPCAHGRIAADQEDLLARRRALRGRRTSR